MAAAQLNCIHLVHTMAKQLPAWLPKPLFEIALQRWRSPDFASRWALCSLLLLAEAEVLPLPVNPLLDAERPTLCPAACCCRLATAAALPLAQRLEGKWLARIMLSYIRQHHEAFAALFDMMVVFSAPVGACACARRNPSRAAPASLPACLPAQWPSLAGGTAAAHHDPWLALPALAAAVDFTFLKTFISEVVAQEFSAEEKRQVRPCPHAMLAAAPPSRGQTVCARAFVQLSLCRWSSTGWTCTAIRSLIRTSQVLGTVA